MPVGSKPQLYFDNVQVGQRIPTLTVVAPGAQRTTSTGSFECVSTFWVSLPSTSAAT